MIKAIIWDMDGTAVNCKELHRRALNDAIAQVANPKYMIEDNELDHYEAMPTTTKLVMLNEDKGLPVEFFDKIWKRKQELTLELIEKYIEPNNHIARILDNLQEFKVGLCTNSIRQTTEAILNKAGIYCHFCHILTNNDVFNYKPHPEIYLKCMLEFEVAPRETVILEDSPRGMESAIRSGAWLFPVASPNDISYDNLMNFIKSIQQ